MLRILLAKKTTRRPRIVRNVRGDGVREGEYESTRAEILPKWSQENLRHFLDPRLSKPPYSSNSTDRITNC